MKLSNFIEGLQIFAKYEDPENHIIVTADDDQIFLRTDRELSTEDYRRIGDLGWFGSSFSGCWSVFV